MHVGLILLLDDSARPAGPLESKTHVTEGHESSAGCGAVGDVELAVRVSAPLSPFLLPISSAILATSAQTPRRLRSILYLPTHPSLL